MIITCLVRSLNYLSCRRSPRETPSPTLVCFGMVGGARSPAAACWSAQACSKSTELIHSARNQAAVSMSVPASIPENQYPAGERGDRAPRAVALAVFAGVASAWRGHAANYGAPEAERITNSAEGRPVAVAGKPVGCEAPARVRLSA